MQREKNGVGWCRGHRVGRIFWYQLAQMVKNLPAMQETQVWPLGREDPLEKGMATHSTILAWRIPWTEEPGVLQSVGLQRAGHDWATNITIDRMSGVWFWAWKCPDQLWSLSPVNFLGLRILIWKRRWTRWWVGGIDIHTCITTYYHVRWESVVAVPIFTLSLWLASPSPHIQDGADYLIWRAVCGLKTCARCSCTASWLEEISFFLWALGPAVNYCAREDDSCPQE